MFPSIVRIKHLDDSSMNQVVHIKRPENSSLQPVVNLAQPVFSVNAKHVTFLKDWEQWGVC